jgi:hypothetical protein
MQTTELNGTLVQLESLYNSYNTILDQAKQQLEKIDLDDNARKRISEDIAKDTDLRKALSEQLFRDMRSDLQDADEATMNSYVASNFVQLLSEKIYEQITQKLDNYVKELVDNIFTSDYIERELQKKVDANTDIAKAIRTRSQMKAAIQILMTE